MGEELEIKRKVRKIHQDIIQCPSCKANLEILVERETLTPSVKGEYQTRTSVYKTTQTSLDDITEGE